MIKKNIIFLLTIFTISSISIYGQGKKRPNIELTNFSYGNIDLNKSKITGKIVSLDKKKNIYTLSETNATRYDSLGNIVWQKQLNPSYKYYLRSSTGGEVTIIDEVTTNSSVSKYIINQTGEIIIQEKEFVRFSPSGKYLYESNSYFDFRNSKVYDAENGQEVSMLGLTTDLSDYEFNSTELRFITDDLIIIKHFENEQIDGDYVAKLNADLVKAELRLYSMSMKKFVINHNLMNLSKNDEGYRYNRVNIDEKSIYVVNKKLFFYELRDDGRHKIIVYDIETGELVFEKVETSLVDFMPDKNGRIYLALKLLSGEKHLIVNDLVEKSETNLGKVFDINQISDFKLIGNSLTILQKSNIFNSETDTIIQKDLGNNSTKTLKGTFSNASFGIITSQEKLYSIQND